MKVVFAGGGSGGPVAPLLAIYEQLKKQDSDIKAVWVGTNKGPEKKMTEPYDLDFRVITSGKLRRYFSGWNLIDPFKIFIGFLQSLIILKKEKPAVVLAAGGFVAVPVFYAAWFLKIPRITHQQDILPGLANKIMAKIASKITITFSESLKDYPEAKTTITSNPVRKLIFSGSKEKAIEQFKLETNLKTILVVGGGQGAKIINETVFESLLELLAEYQIIHLTGQGNLMPEQVAQKYLPDYASRYHAYEFLQTEIFNALAAADLVISRAGMSFLTEISVLGKPAIIIPITGHQELNAQYYAKKNAVRVIQEKNLNKENLIKMVNGLLANSGDLSNLSRNISQIIDKNAAKKYADVVVRFLSEDK